jgi:hypothetical protein
MGSLERIWQLKLLNQIRLLMEDGLSLNIKGFYKVSRKYLIKKFERITILFLNSFCDIIGAAILLRYLKYIIALDKYGNNW